METRNCQNCKTDFVIESEDADFYEKIKVPKPTFCPDCRNIQRMATRNAKSLYKRACDNCGTMVVSRFSPNNPAKMFCTKCWWSDDWDVLSYGKEYDFSRPFFEQFHELLFSVPHVSIFSSNMVNSDYSNMESDNKECYLTFGGHWNEYCAFSEYSIHGKEVYDSYWSFAGEQCYDNINIERCYRTLYSQECKDCLNAYFSYDCRGCTEIIGCAGLRQKSYCIFNQQYSKEEYFIEKARMNFGSRAVVQELREKARNIWHSTPHLFMASGQVVNCTGNDIFNSKNAMNVWQVDGMENVKNIYIGAWSKDCYDETSTAGNELGYLNTSGGGMYNCKALLYSFTSDFKNKKHAYNDEYSYMLLSSSDCFGCVGLRKKQYCILNKQYTKEEYEELLPRITQHMNDMPFTARNGLIFRYGDFFPNEHSLFAYNETVANDFYPVTKSQAENWGFVWREDAPSEYTLTEYTIPDSIDDVGDDILQAVLKCEHSGKAYKITTAELAFYRKMNIPIPTVAPLERIRGRVMQLLPFKLHHRPCMCDQTGHDHADACPRTFDTAYAPDRPEKVYCAHCYQQEVV